MAGPEAAQQVGPAANAWLWENQDFADCKLRLHQLYSAKRAKRAVQDNPGAQSTVLLELPCHRTVLASMSEVFKAKLLRWGVQPESPQGSGSSAACVLEEGITSGDLAAAKHALRFAYTMQLPEGATVPELLQVARMADRWHMASCLTACLTQLAAKPADHFTAADVNSIMGPDVPDGILQHADYEALINGKCAEVLLHLFGRAQAVMRDERLLASFRRLRYDAVKLWMAQDNLKVDNENTVAVLITLWWYHNWSWSWQVDIFVESDEEEEEEQQANELTRLLRVNHLSRSFALGGVLEHMSWFTPRDKALRLLRCHNGKLDQLAPWLKEQLPPAWHGPARQQDDEQVAALSWQVSKEQLEQLHQDAAVRGAEVDCGEHLFWGGYNWQLVLSLDSRKSALFLGCAVSSALPRYGYMAPALGVEFRLSCERQQGPKLEVVSYVDVSSTSTDSYYGSDSLLGVPETAEPRAHSLPPRRYWVDGKLQLQLEMLQVE